MKSFLISIDLPLLRANLSKEDGRDFSDTETRQWLLEAGFTPRDDRWLVSEPNLGHLDPSEVLSADVLDEALNQ